jgi:hypothetical protein
MRAEQRRGALLFFAVEFRPVFCEPNSIFMPAPDFDEENNPKVPSLLEKQDVFLLIIVPAG